jgi:hypothetical protein
VQWCQWELKLVEQLMFENNADFLVLVELTRLPRDELPSTLRLLMSTRTYLEWPVQGGEVDMNRFWSRLRTALGQPLALIQPRSEEPETLENQNPLLFLHSSVEKEIEAGLRLSISSDKNSDTFV